MHHLHKCEHLTGAYELRTNAEVLEPDGPHPKVTPPLTAATLASNVELGSVKCVNESIVFTCCYELTIRATHTRCSKCLQNLRSFRHSRCSRPQSCFTTAGRTLARSCWNVLLSSTCPNKLQMPTAHINKQIQQKTVLKTTHLKPNTKTMKAQIKPNMERFQALHMLCAK